MGAGGGRPISWAQGTGAERGSNSLRLSESEEPLDRYLCWGACLSEAAGPLCVPRAAVTCFLRSVWPLQLSLACAEGRGGQHVGECIPLDLPSASALTRDPPRKHFRLHLTRRAHLEVKLSWRVSVPPHV